MIVENVIEKLKKLDRGSGYININITVDVCELIKIIKDQQQKGLDKYGHSIDDCPNGKFDWRRMKLEELADYLIYEEKEQHGN